MRVLPRSLFGRLVLTLVGALLVAQLASAALTLWDRGRLLHDQAGWQAAQRAASVVRVLEQVEPRARRRLARALSTRPLTIRLRREPLPPTGTEVGGAARAMIAAVLERRLGGGRPIHIESIGADSAPEPDAGPGAPMNMNAPMNATGPMYMPGMHRRMMGDTSGMYRWMTGGVPRAYRIQVQLSDGTWAIFDHVGDRELFDWPVEFFVGIALLLVSVVAVSLWVVRRVTRPLAMLAGAAEALGRDLKTPPLPETGPLEVSEAAHAFNTMQARLARFVDDRTRILAAVSHDLKTPLTRLKLRAEMLDDEAARERFGSDLDEMKQMVQSALDFARGLDDGEATRAIDVEALCASIAEDMSSGDRVHVTGGAAAYRGRALALKRAIDNLVANALRYGGGEVEVSLADGPRELTIAVLDRGPGIPENELGRVLEPYYRVEGSRSRESGGSGLGLSIASAVARAHGGTLELANREGGGLAATLVLPR